MLSKIIEQSDIDRISKLIAESDDIVIVAHVSPDGDAIGASLGLYHFLSFRCKYLKIIVPNAFPDFLKWMPGSNQILFYEEHKEIADKYLQNAGLIFCLDFNEAKRTFDMADSLVASPAKKVMIDHHLSPDGFCDVTVSHPECCSTSELIFRLIYQMDCFNEINKKGAECIYTGMMTDTGGFTYNSNNREIYFIISELLSRGIDKDEIYRKVFYTYSESRMRLMGHVLDTMRTYPDYNSALLILSDAELKNYKFKKGDSEGFVNIPLQINNVIFSVFLREDKEKNMIKVSLRSVGTFPCNKVAAEFFNGGGHLNASGGEFYGSMDEAVQAFELALNKYKSLLVADNKK